MNTVVGRWNRLAISTSAEHSAITGLRETSVEYRKWVLTGRHVEQPSISVGSSALLSATRIPHSLSCGPEERKDHVLSKTQPPNCLVGWFISSQMSETRIRASFHSQLNALVSRTGRLHRLMWRCVCLTCETLFDVCPSLSPFPTQNVWKHHFTANSGAKPTADLLENEK